jgi:3-oxoacyl-[acyl-carrier protein] reductase
MSGGQGTPTGRSPLPRHDFIHRGEIAQVGEEHVQLDDIGQAAAGRPRHRLHVFEHLRDLAADIDRDGAENTAAEIRDTGRRALAVEVDVAERSKVDRMVTEVTGEFGGIDILVNNAGASSRLKPFVEMTRSDWELDINVNLYGQMNVAQAVLAGMLARRSGRIINISGGQGIPTISVYGAAKAGIEAWTLALAGEVGGSGIIVNGVSPGLGETGLVADAPREHLEGYRQGSTLKRLCTPRDVAPVVAFLASEVCSYMNGQFVVLSAS